MEYLVSKKTKNKPFVFASMLVVFILCILHRLAFAADSSVTDLTSLSDQTIGQIRSVATLIIVVSYVAGVGFMLAGIVQFKAHKDNPAQVPLSKPIVYLIVGACLLFLPTVITTAGTSIFGSDKKSGGAYQDATSDSSIDFGD